MVAEAASMTMSQKFSCASGHWYVRLRSIMLTRAVLAMVGGRPLGSLRDLGMGEY